MRRNIMIGLSVFMLVGFIQSYAIVDAAIVNLDNSGAVTSIESLYIPSYGTFNVDFYYGTYNSIWDDSFDLNDFNQLSGAVAVHNAINDTLNSLASQPTSIVFNIYGGEGTSIWADYLTPYWGSLNNGQSWEVYAVDSTCGDANFIPTPGNWYIADQMNGSPAQNYTVAYAKLSPAPIPGSVWLLGSGLFCLIGVGWRSKKYFPFGWQKNSEASA